MAGKIELKNVSKSPYFGKTSFSFELRPGKIISVYGNNRTSLTYLLKVISGLSSFDSGELLYNDTKSLPLFPFIPCEPASFPWASVKGNVESVPDRKKDAQSVLNAVGLQGYENHFPDSNSIGFRFRISLARALSLDPALIIIDNSFSETDAETKEELFALLKTISAEQGVTFLYSSTDIKDAAAAAGEVVVLNEKSAVQGIKFTLTGNTKEDLLTIIKDSNAG